ncbi:DEAD/DEAH box helicase [Granulosicoccus sp. 3-233]|uniref:DEAD/DEAH box helicase n=1 Tax=Granulosicoccus sp. 3-233 TaxID=3417969 RepID=UPI003D34BF93
MSFNAPELVPKLTTRLTELGLVEPTPVQAALFAPLSEGRDVLVAASTGSGKTLGYLLPLLNRRLQSQDQSQPCTLIIVPTRELVHQLAAVLSDFKAVLEPCKVVRVCGGSSINTQLMSLRGGADFLLATPGRLLDVIAHNGLDVAAVDILVLDEADRLLGDGFQEQLDELVALFKPRQRLMVSATYTRKVRAKAGWLLKKPVIVDLAQDAPVIRHRAIQVDEQQRGDLLIRLLSEGRLSTPLLIFTADRKGAEKLSDRLCKASIDSAALHGKLSMAQRASVLRRLQEGRLQALVATDLAARGIDVPSLPLVVSYDLPRSVELYTHRMGRTARAGKTGEAISLVDINAEAHLTLMEKRLSLSIPRERVEGFEPTNSLRPVIRPVDGNGGIKGHRMSKKDKLRAAAARVQNDPDSSGS